MPGCGGGALPSLVSAAGGATGHPQWLPEPAGSGALRHPSPDGYYNLVRRHSTIGYHSPIDYEQQLINTRTLTPVELTPVH
jgi:transposase InsO family protein